MSITTKPQAGQLTEAEFQARVVRVLAVLDGLHLGQIDHLLSTARQVVTISTTFSVNSETAARIIADRPRPDGPPN